MSDEQSIRIGTRGSRLALWQANEVARRISGLSGAPGVELVEIKTEGDRIQDVPLSSIDGKGFFTKEIETALIEDRVDLAVHSLKDLETEMPEGLELGAVMEREDPRDVLIAREGWDLESLPAGAGVGTSSLRRRALLARWRSDLELAELRGNVPTRIRKLEEGQYDAIVLAAAGVKRLGLEKHISAYLPTDRVPPAAGQAAVAVQIREGDQRIARWVRELDHESTRWATTAERALLHELEGGCQVPLGALAHVREELLTLEAVVCDPSGARAVEGRIEGPKETAESMGRSLARDLLQRGADAILRDIRERTREDNE